MNELTITKPDDWHIHLRDGPFLKTTVPHAAQRFARAIVMPNLTPPICEVEQAYLYREAILAVLPPDTLFQPLMTLYLTNDSEPSMIQLAKESQIIYGCKLYPAGSTTHSDLGVSSIAKIYPLLDMMQKIDLPLLIHGEVTDPSVDIFDREAAFIDTILAPLCANFPQLRIVLEHITTKEAVDFVSTAQQNVAATITPHHLMLNRNDLLAGGIRPHHYCLPILKRKAHQEALIDVVKRGHPRFFLGTDSAPHTKMTKENACGCAGIYTAHAAIELCCEIFESIEALDKMEAFTSVHGANFYQLPRNEITITLRKDPWMVPNSYRFGQSELVPFCAGKIINWKLVTAT